MNGISQGYTIVLMCGCKEYSLCHRQTVVSLLRDAMPEATIEMPDVASPEGTLKCLSIQQPWAWLIVNGYKDIENRDWTTSHRGPVLIHAGARLDRDCFETDGSVERDYINHVKAICGQSIPDQEVLYPVKSIVGRATLVDVVEQSHSPWFVGHYGFVFINAKPFKEPIRSSGSLKLFDVPSSVVAHMEREQ